MAYFQIIAISQASIGRITYNPHNRNLLLRVRGSNTGTFGVLSLNVLVCAEQLLSSTTYHGYAPMSSKASAGGAGPTGERGGLEGPDIDPNRGDSGPLGATRAVIGVCS